MGNLWHDVVTSCHLLYERQNLKTKKAFHFVKNALSSLGVIFIWTGFWTFIDEDVVESTFLREVLFSVVGFVILALTNTLITNALVVDIDDVFQQPVVAQPVNRTRKFGRVLVVWLACIASQLGVVLVQTGIYNILDLYTFPEKFRPWTDVAIMFISFIGMALTGCFHSTAGFDVYPLSPRVLQSPWKLWSLAATAQTIISINWEATWVLLDDFLAPVTFTREIIYIYVGILLFICTGTWDGKDLESALGSFEEAPLTTEDYLKVPMRSIEWWSLQMRSYCSVWAISFYWVGIWDILLFDLGIEQSGYRDLAYTVIGIVISTLTGQFREDSEVPYSWFHQVAGDVEPEILVDEETGEQPSI